jgi:hypothetical protein
MGVEEEVGAVSAAGDDAGGGEGGAGPDDGFSYGARGQDIGAVEGDEVADAAAQGGEEERKGRQGEQKCGGQESEGEGAKG